MNRAARFGIPHGHYVRTHARRTEPNARNMFSGFWNDFKAFAVRGNIIDLAVGVVIGAAFNKIIDAVVKGLISPPLGYLTGGVTLGEKIWTPVDPQRDADGVIVEGTGVVIEYGLVLETMIDFLIMALTIFTVLRFFKTYLDKAEDEKNAEVPTPKDIQLLGEIRDGIDRLNGRGAVPKP